MRLRIGYVPLCDAAPLMAAQALGFARAEGLDLDLSAEPSWATLRDRLALGHLDAAHMLAPLALASRLALSGPPSDVLVPLALSRNGNAITLSLPLWEAVAATGESDTLPGVARAFARIAAERRAAWRHPTPGTVHPFSCHTYLLRLFAEAGAAGESSAAFRIVAVPPHHCVAALSRGLVDGYCAGAPWNDVAVAAQLGRLAAFGADLAPDAPEKVLAVSGRLGEATLPLVRAVAKAGLWCADPANRAEMIRLLAGRACLALDPGLVGQAFAGRTAPNPETGDREAPAALRLGAPAQEPRPEDACWLAGQMRASRRVTEGEAGRDIAAEAKAVYRPDLFHAATAD